MDSVFSFVVGLLTAALSLLGFVQQHPELPQASKDQAQQIAQQAITQATQTLANAPKAKTPSDNIATQWKILNATTDWSSGNSISYSIEYPSNWNVESRNNDRFLSFLLSGKKYTFEILEGGGGFDAGKFSDLKVESVIFGSKRFEKKSWLNTNSEVGFIAYTSLDYPAPFESILVSVPMTQNAEYVALFDRVLKTLKYPVE